MITPQTCRFALDLLSIDGVLRSPGAMPQFRMAPIPSCRKKKPVLHARLLIQRGHLRGAVFRLQPESFHESEVDRFWLSRGRNGFPTGVWRERKNKRL